MPRKYMVETPLSRPQRRRNRQHVRLLPAAAVRGCFAFIISCPPAFVNSAPAGRAFFDKKVKNPAKTVCKTATDFLLTWQRQNSYSNNIVYLSTIFLEGDAAHAGCIKNRAIIHN